MPSTVIENPNSPTSPIQPEGSVVADRSRYYSSPPTPGPHDDQYVRFALDQLTRDEEVRGSRRYADSERGRSVNPLYPLNTSMTQPSASHNAPMRENRNSAPALVSPLGSRHRSKAEQILGKTQP